MSRQVVGASSSCRSRTGLQPGIRAKNVLTNDDQGMKPWTQFAATFRKWIAPPAPETKRSMTKPINTATTVRQMMTASHVPVTLARDTSVGNPGGGVGGEPGFVLGVLRGTMTYGCSVVVVTVVVFHVVVYRTLSVVVSSVVDPGVVNSSNHDCSEGVVVVPRSKTSSTDVGSSVVTII